MHTSICGANLQNLAMVVGLCLEMVLFWDVFSCYRTVGMRSSIRNRILTAPASQQMWGKIQTQAQQMCASNAQKTPTHQDAPVNLGKSRVVINPR
jgi:hypothetical protein